MDAKNILQQAPRPEVVIYDPDGKEKMRFDTSHRKILQGYTFGTSVNDEKGKFSLTFYPDEEDRKDSFFDDVAPMDVVEIYESMNHFRQYRIDMGRTLVQEVLPTFTGVIREKKFAAQMTDRGPRRSIVFSGHSIIGLVQEFMVNMDIQAQVLTKEMINNRELETAFTIELMRTDNEPLKVSFVVKKIWETFLKVSEDHERSTNPKISEYLKKWVGENFFAFDDSYFHYPLASVFRGQTTQNFYDVIDGIIPSMVYEKFPFTERKTGKMKINIRECPFDADDWAALQPCTEIKPILVKSFDLRQSDSEVYTYFFSYLNGYPIQEDKAIILAAQGVKESPGGILDTEKYPIYGYRPLFARFNGYGTADGKADGGTGDRLKLLNERLKNWYGNLDKMFSGNISLVTDLSMDMPQAGERVSFLGGEFYVVDSEHRWNYGEAPETNISVSRGGVYSISEEPVGEEIVINGDAQSYTVKDSDKLKQIAVIFYGIESKVQLIIDANSFLSGRPISAEGLPIIYGAVPWSPNPGHAADVLTIPPDPDKIKKIERNTVSKRIEFTELKDITKRYREFKKGTE